MARKKTPNSGMAKFQERQRLINLTALSGLPEAEIGIAIERYLLDKARKEAMKAKRIQRLPLLLPGSTLPDEISTEQQRGLVQRAKELGISGGEYEDWEIVQSLNAAVGSRDEIWLGVLEAVMLGDGIERDLAILTTYAISTPGKLWNETPQGERQFPSFITKEYAGNLSDRYTQMLIMARDLDIPPEAVPNPTLFIAGIANLLTGTDNGKVFRKAADDYAPVADNLRRWAVKRKTPGVDRSEVIDRLCKRAKPYVEKGMTTDQILRQLADDTENNAETADEYAQASNWSDAAFNSAYRLRYS